MKRAFLLLNSWAGLMRVPVEIVGETPMRYRVKLLKDALMPNRIGLIASGSVKLVPKHAVVIEKART